MSWSVWVYLCVCFCMCAELNLQLIKVQAVSYSVNHKLLINNKCSNGRGKLLIKNSCCYSYSTSANTPPYTHTHTHTQMIYLGAFDCALIATAIKWKDKVNKGTKPYHLDNKSPHVSRIFSAHSLETSPDPLSNGSSLSGHREKRSQMFQIYQDVANFTRGHFVLRCLMECLL